MVELGGDTEEVEQLCVFYLYDTKKNPVYRVQEWNAALRQKEIADETEREGRITGRMENSRAERGMVEKVVSKSYIS